MKILKIALIALLAAGLLLPGCGKKGSSGASTPQALFEELKGKNPDDFKDVATYIAPDELPVMTFTMDMMASFATAFSPDKTLKTKYDALRKKYSLPTLEKGKMNMRTLQDTDAAMKYAAEKYANVDHAGFIADVSELMDKSTGKAKKTKKEKILAELKDVKINGDKATGVVVDKDGKKDKIAFKKVNGKWYLSLKDMMMKR